jgi:hypothetical protein
VAEQRLNHDQVLDCTAALTAVLLGHRDAKEAFSADAVENLAVWRFVGLVPRASFVCERAAELLGPRL